ncbi:MAG: DUF3516 domain-containing protein, partial [Fibrobacteria bacterium]
VTHAMLLNVLGRPGDGCAAMRRLIADSHETAKDKAAHRKRAFQLFRSLVERGIVEITQPAERGSAERAAGERGGGDEAGPGGRGKPKLRVNLDLQQNFSMDQTLSLYLLDTLPLLNVESPEHHLDLLTLAEAILEDPDLVLRRQLDMLKTERMAELKAQGVEFDQRIAELEAMEHPKPLREFVYQTFNDFTEKHPWVGGGNIRPKSIAREMLEGYYTFSGYIKRYGLERSEGLLLRHLNSVYKVLANTIPESFKTEPVREMEAFFGDLVRRVDSSLLEEWERLKDPDFKPELRDELLPPGAEAAAEAARAAARDVTLDVKAFTTVIRTRVFGFLASLARYDVAGAFEALGEGLGDGGAGAGAAGGSHTAAALAMAALSESEDAPWSEERLRKALEGYRADHGMFRLDPEGRSPLHTVIDRENFPGSWRVEQMLQDHEGHNDGKAAFEVDLAASKAAGAPVLRLIGFG